MNDVSVPAAFSQLLSLGVVWVFFHCAGMCGPIVGGLRIGGITGLLLYQSGRALTLGALGALSGVLGAQVAGIAERGGAVLSLVGAIGVGLVALRPIKAVSARVQGAQIGSGASPLERLWQRVVRGLFALGALRPLALGVALGFLPCMIVAWALSLAASTASPGWGFLIMLTLVAMTTPMLSLAALLPRALSALAGSRAALLHRALLLISALWLLLVALAGFGVIPHAHARLWVMGREVVVMFF